MGILLWLLFGLIAGAVAKMISPGPDPGGWIGSIVVGILGAMLGGWLGSMLLGVDVDGFNISSLLIAIGGALVLLLIYRAVMGRR
ncbi:GlsB/YeaQ/YmgE family stress response membrane protein [Weeksellaceae bacterium KMM 9713]|uniref:GlsB/YeaQ/YmgE family stress response membrane protein n=1 Tax=Profundicola chukchiensis TaxID=2961959 RepID=A0A9X4RX87_9FLAO|nr:GlsB/YeaQ/YmgE family stress response membrane protein [Profundicola chukchiensis]MDG4946587.1 GlsB/YeaQ/YmgE family stress response membrane protein [Profundicola chukchiensis]MDG4950606.1 GlsB/YeaQ/YmgE family stress response membrane protein [Profundicola chukchiensis]